MNIHFAGNNFSGPKVTGKQLTPGQRQMLEASGAGGSAMRIVKQSTPGKLTDAELQQITEAVRVGDAVSIEYLPGDSGSAAIRAKLDELLDGQAFQKPEQDSLFLSTSNVGEELRGREPETDLTEIARSALNAGGDGTSISAALERLQRFLKKD